MANWEIVLIIIAAAFGPGLFWLWYFYRRDTLEPEPLRLILNCFLLGMACTLPAIFLERAVPLPKFYLNVAVAPVIEELCKFLIVYLIVYSRPEFDEPIDGLVYAAAVALGFASIENFFYLYHEYQKASGTVTIVAALRAFLSVPGHALFSCMWGYALGMAKFSPGRSALRIVTGLLLAMALHALFNFAVNLGPLMLWGMLILVPVMWQLMDERVAEALQSSPHSPKQLTENLKDVKSALINRDESWYESRFIVVFLMFFMCFPLGMYGLWKTSKFSKPVKTVYLAIWLVFFVGAASHVPSGSSELINAARSGNNARLHEILGKGAKVNGKTETGETALIAASKNGHLEAVRLLLNSGADVNVSDNQDRTALLYASAAGHSAVIQLLIEKQAYVDSRDKAGATALTMAAANGHTETVRLLLQGKADVSLRQKDGLTALMLASSRGDVAIVQLMLENKADINVRNSKGETALILAAMQGRTGAVRILLEHGADANVKDVSGRNALTWASQKEHKQVVRLIEAQGELSPTGTFLQEKPRANPTLKDSPSKQEPYPEKK